ncbi:MAG: hypothetical protein ABEI13_00740 [Candidatus Paceibacteria bacterium]
MSTPSDITTQTTIMNRNRPIVAKATATTENGFQIETVGRSTFTEGRAIKHAESALDSQIQDVEYSYEIIGVKTGPLSIEVLDNEIRFSGGWKTVLRFGSLNSNARTLPIPPQKVRIRMYDENRSVESTGWSIRSLSKAVKKARKKGRERI